MEINTTEFMALQQAMSQKDVRIAQLESEVEQLRRERDLWEARALGGVPAEDAGGVERSRRSRFIVISSQKLKALLVKVQNLKVASLVAFVLQKTLPDGADAADYKAISEVMPTPQLPKLNITADTVEVNGDWNDVHDNRAVNF